MKNAYPERIETPRNRLGMYFRSGINYFRRFEKVLSIVLAAHNDETIELLVTGGNDALLKIWTISLRRKSVKILKSV